MKPARILLGAISEEWQHLFAAMVEGGGLIICGSFGKPVDLLVATGRLAPDVVVLSRETDDAEPGIYSHLILEYPNVGVLMLPDRPGGGPLQWGVLRKGVLDYLSPKSLSMALDTILECGTPRA